LQNKKYVLSVERQADTKDILQKLIFLYFLFSTAPLTAAYFSISSCLPVGWPRTLSFRGKIAIDAGFKLEYFDEIEF